MTTVSYAYNGVTVVMSGTTTAVASSHSSMGDATAPLTKL